MKYNNTSSQVKFASTVSLMTIFAQSIFAAGAVNVNDYKSEAEAKAVLSTPTLTALHNYDSTKYPFSSDYTLTENTTATSSLGYQTIAKYLISYDENGDITYTHIYYDLQLNSITGTGDTLYNNYYWDSNGKLTTDSTDNTFAFSVYYDSADSSSYVSQTNAKGYGGAINNYDGSTTAISGNFIGNSATTSEGEGEISHGGAIYNYGATMTSIAGDFIENSADTGGAIYNVNTTIAELTGNFGGNSGGTLGGAIYNDNSDITTITGDFIANTAGTHGGAIYNNNSSDIDTLIGDFIGNSATNSGGAIYNLNSSEIGTIIGDFIGNTAGTYGGAISNLSTIDTITGNFIGNATTGSDSGGAIFNDIGAKITTIEGDFIDNTSASHGGAILNKGAMTTIVGDFIGNSSSGSGGAICNLTATGSDTAEISSITGDFIGNYAYGSGGAIWNSGLINIYASGDDVNFTGNYTKDSEGNITSNAIYNYATINLYAYGDNEIVVNDGIDGTADRAANQVININTINDSDAENSITYSVVEFNNSVEYQTINVNAGTLKLGSYAGGLVVSTDSYTTSASTASLSDSVLIVASSATLNIATTNAVAVKSTDVTLNAGSELLLDTSSIFAFDSDSTLSIVGAGDADVTGAGTVKLATGSSVSIAETSALVFNTYSTLELDGSGSVSITGAGSLTLETGSNVVFDLDSKITGSNGANASLADDIDIYLSVEFALTGDSYTLELFDDVTITYASLSSSEFAYDLYIGDTLYSDSKYANTYTYEWYDDGDSAGIVFSAQVVPEPSTYAMIFGALALGLGIYRRRK